MVTSRRPLSHPFAAIDPVPEYKISPSPPTARGDADPGRDWTAQILVRMRHLLWLKAIGISVFMWLFFIGYFHLLRNPVFPMTQMPLTALDRAIPFQPTALVAYVSLWLYVGIPPGLVLGLRPLIVYGLWVGGLCSAGLTLFYFFPTAVPPHGLGAEMAAHPAFAMLQGVDAAGNACPSLHVATALFSAIWIDRLFRDVTAPTVLRALNACWLILIVYSTLAIKQHVVLDVLAGAMLGSLFAVASLRWRPAPPHA